MRKEIKTVVYDDELRLEAYRFEGVVQPFSNHFHEYYVIGFVEGGERCLSCRNQEYTIGKGNVILFNPAIAMRAFRQMTVHWITGDLILQKKSCWIWQKKSQGNGNCRGFRKM